MLLTCAQAQELVVRASIDSTSILIGEQTRLKLSAFFTSPTEKKVIWPKLSDTITSKLEIVIKGKIDTSVTGDSKTIWSQELIVTSFDSGYHAIPPFQFSIAGDSISIFETEAMLLQVNTVPVDTTAAIKEIKSPVDVPFHWKEALPYIIGGIAILAVLVALIIYIKRRKKQKPAEIKIEDTRTPAEIALEQLNRLKEEKLWQQGRVKEFHIRLSDILRIYIETRFGIPAMEQTSDELLGSLRNTVGEEQRAKIRQVLLLADLVKFAKETPVSYENELSIQNTEGFIIATGSSIKKEEENEVVSS